MIEDDAFSIEFAPWEGKRVPITFLGGYLGSGKTTILNKLLARTDKKIALLINDVGQVNIDAQLLKKKSPNKIELTNGCVCCSLAEGFAAAFDSLRKDPEMPDHIIVELSGVADPSRVRPWAFQPGFRLDGIVVMVDVVNYLEFSSNDAIGQQIDNQLKAADLIVLSKTDLVSEQQQSKVRRHLRETYKDVKIIHVKEFESIIEIGGSKIDASDLPVSSLFDIHTVDVESFGDLETLDQLENYVTQLNADEEIIRMKGICEIVDGSRFLVQAVGSYVNIELLSKAEWVEPTKLVVIKVDKSSTRS